MSYFNSIVRNFGSVARSAMGPAKTTLPKHLNEQPSVAAFMQGIDAVMFDCDGVLWLESYVFPDAPNLIDKLRAMGKKIFFMTNNSTRTRAQFKEKFESLGFKASVDEIVGTSYLAALHLKELGFHKKVYVVGTEGVTKELEAVNIRSLPIGPDPVPEGAWGHSIFNNTDLDPDVGAVIVGFDHYLSYTKLYKATSYLNDPNCIFIATNTDESFPAGRNRTIPGTGSIVSAVRTAAGREPIVMGKPSVMPFEIVKRSHNLEANRVLMIGDRGNTDILFGNNCGMKTLLVLTGVTKLHEVTQWVNEGSELEKGCVPDYFCESVSEMYNLLMEGK